MQVTIHSHKLDDEITLEAKTPKELIQKFMFNCEFEGWGINEIEII